jgi:hypothetical protein
MEAVWQALLGHIEARASYFSLFDRYRMRPDAWLKVETLAVLAPLVGSSVKQMRPDRQGCDVWLGTADGEYWLTVKGLLTSYAGAGREARSTIVAVEETAREMDKLRGLSTLSGGHPALLLAALPFGPHPREQDEWKSQLLRFEAKGFQMTGIRTVALQAEREARVYLFT